MKLDLRKVYYRVRIKEGDKWKITFNCLLGSYQFNIMLFGLQGGPTVLVQIINEVLHDQLYKVYLDDILIYIETMEEYIKVVCQILKKLLKGNLCNKLSKCEFQRPAYAAWSTK